MSHRRRDVQNLVLGTEAANSVDGRYLRLARAERGSLIEHHAPTTVRLQAPDGVEPAGQLARRILHRTARKGQPAGVEYFGEIWRPRKWRGRTVEKHLPGGNNRRPSTKDLTI